MKILVINMIATTQGVNNGCLSVCTHYMIGTVLIMCITFHVISCPIIKTLISSLFYREEK